MPVTLEHLKDHGVDIAVISGLANESSLAHLCRTLSSGVALDDVRVAVVNVNELPTISPQSVAILRSTAQHCRALTAPGAGASWVDPLGPIAVLTFVSLLRAISPRAACQGQWP